MTRPSPGPGSPVSRVHGGPTSRTTLAPNVLVATGQWSWQNPLPSGNPFTAISCPTTSTCFAGAIDGRIAATTTGGTTWTGQTSGILAGINGLSCASATACVGVGNFGEVVWTTDGINWNHQVENSGNFLAGVSCPTSSICFAVGFKGSILTSGDGGASWTAQTSSTTNSLFGISCTSTNTCYAVGFAGVIVGTANGGSTWSNETTTGSNNSLFAVSCSSASFCVAVGQGGVVQTTSSGSIWNQAVNAGIVVSLFGVSCTSGPCLVAGIDGFLYTGSIGPTTPWPGASTPEPGGLFAISCPSTLVCFAAGDAGMVVTTTDGGTSWTQPGSITTSSLYAVNCPSATDCTAVGFGGEVFYTTSGGTSWTQQSTGLVTTSNLVSVNCPVATVCFAGTDTGVIVKSGGAGTAWTLQSSGVANRINGISCASATVCVAVTSAGAAITTINGGTTWNAPLTVSGFPTTGVSCPTTSVCYATDSSPTGRVYVSTNGGSNWTLNFDLATDPNAGTSGSFNAIFCADATTCYAAGTTGLVASTTDGANWRSDFTGTSSQLSGISCPSRGTCFMSSFSAAVIHTTDFGDLWDVQNTGTSGNQGISCLSTTSCVAVGITISLTTNGGAAFTRQLSTGSTGPIDGMSCTSASDCYAAAGDTLLTTHNGGTTWSTHQLTTTDFLTGMSCPAANTCFAVGWPGAIYFTGDGGTTWTYQTNSLSGHDQTLLSVSCATVTNCVAVGTSGTIISTSNGSTWATETSATTQPIFGVSCPNTSTCVAVGVAGLSMTRTAGSWHAYPSGTNHNLFGVSCPGATTCYAVGDSGTLLYTPYRGGAWYAQTSGTPQLLFGISCLRTTMCLAVGDGGTTIVTLDGSTWTSLATQTFNALRAAAFVDLSHAWAAGLGGTVLATSNITNGCASAAVTPDKASPQPVGLTVVLTASSTGCTSPMYEFFLQYPDGTWTMKQAFGFSATWSWNTTGYPAGTYNIHVWANQKGDMASPFEALGALTYTLVVLPACTGASLSPTNPSAPAGTTVSLTASSTGCPNPVYEFWVGYPDGTWHLKQGFSSSATFNWDTTGLAPGTYSVHVWANQAGHSTSTFEAFGTDAVTLTGCATAALSPSSVAQPAGSTVSLTASSTGCPNPVYEFWVGYPDGTYHMKQAFNASASFSWNTTGLAPGMYSVHVWANQQGASTATWEANGAASVALSICTSAALSPTNPSAAAGTTVTLTASSTGCASPQYEFWVQYPNGTWYLVQGWGSATFSWNTAGLGPGTYNVHAWARNTGDPTATFEAYAADVVTLTGCTSAAVTGLPTSPQAVGIPITLTATSSGCPTPVYKFWVQYPDGTWHMLRDFSATPTYIWNTTGLAKGTYVVRVWANNQGAATNTWESFGSTTYVLT
jgi:photosystem II stability/assembly factor-like uncharacterized protein